MPTKTILITKLMNNFRDGLKSLVPVFERVGLGWREEDSYDPWDDTAVALFKAIVVSAIDNSVDASLICDVPNYDTRIKSYKNNSYITESGLGNSAAFVYFTTELEPFDTCVFASLNKEAEVSGMFQKKTANVQFVLVPRGKDGFIKSESQSVTFND